MKCCRVCGVQNSVPVTVQHTPLYSDKFQPLPDQTVALCTNCYVIMVPHGFLTEGNWYKFLVNEIRDYYDYRNQIVKRLRR